MHLNEYFAIVFAYTIRQTVTAIAFSNALSASCLEQKQYCLLLQCN